MDRTYRTIAKAVTWQLWGLVVMTLIAYLVTGSVSEGGAVAVVGAIAGTLSYFVHERVWSRIGWGRHRY